MSIGLLENLAATVNALAATVNAVATDVRILKSRTMSDTSADELGGLELAVKITGLAPRTIYKATHRRMIPHLKRGGRLYFRRSELEAWIAAGRRLTTQELAEERMAENK